MLWLLGIVYSLLLHKFLPNCELQFWSSQFEKFLANSSQKLLEKERNVPRTVSA
jgi:hypothetical protein